MVLPVWLSNLLYVTVSVVAPLVVILLNVLLNLGGVLLTIAMIAWMGFGIILLLPLAE